MVTSSIICPHCQKAEPVIKSGKSDAETQRYKCKDCSKTFATQPKTRRVTSEKEELIARELLERTTMRGICRVAQCSASTVYKVLEKKAKIYQI
ncbi:IS1 family transposase [Armatimonas sp.]|uniref:IS1/IS1595 family N-terminal zinc-binding domain-containing protein n=1 Tax=Armatimonas sp. TaxID=1872638 RepID=UPI0034D9717A